MDQLYSSFYPKSKRNTSSSLNTFYNNTASQQDQSNTHSYYQQPLYIRSRSQNIPRKIERGSFSEAMLEKFGQESGESIRNSIRHDSSSTIDYKNLSKEETVRQFVNFIDNTAKQAAKQLKSKPQQVRSLRNKQNCSSYSKRTITNPINSFSDAPFEPIFEDYYIQINPKQVRIESNSSNYETPVKNTCDETAKNMVQHSKNTPNLVTRILIKERQSAMEFLSKNSKEKGNQSLALLSENQSLIFDETQNTTTSSSQQLFRGFVKRDFSKIQSRQSSKQRNPQISEDTLHVDLKQLRASVTCWPSSKQQNRLQSKKMTPNKEEPTIMDRLKEYTAKVVQRGRAQTAQSLRPKTIPCVLAVNPRQNLNNSSITSLQNSIPARIQINPQNLSIAQEFNPSKTTEKFLNKLRVVSD